MAISTLTVTDVSVTTNSITIAFSAPVDNRTFVQSNVTVYDPPGDPNADSAG